MLRLQSLPLFVVLLALASAAMVVPAAHAVVTEDWTTARVFAQSALLCGILSAFLMVATANWRVRSAARSNLVTLVAVFLLLPVVLAVPIAETVRTTTMFNAWVEMVSSLTTTGATLFEPDRLPPSVHLWRALVGWMGGFFVWVAAVALLAPMTLGGFEITSGAAVGAGARVARVTGPGDAEASRQRMLAAARELLPVYAGLTGALWVGLVMSGEVPFTAAVHAMSVLSTSGISPVGGVEGGSGGMVGEALMLVFFAFALSRACFTTGVAAELDGGLARDPELRLALVLTILVPAFLFLRHWVGAYEVDVIWDFGSALRALWGSVFTVVSFLSTTGFVSEDWATARSWSGLQTPGMALLGLALVGGGVATTAGGVKLLRVYALYKHGMRELDRLVHPSAVSGSGSVARRIRGKGAYVAWIAFMLVAISIAAVAVLLSATGVPFDAALVLAVAALSNCGPVADVVLASPLPLAALDPSAKALLAVAMALGRIETLALVALLNPGFWRV